MKTLIWFHVAVLIVIPYSTPLQFNNNPIESLYESVYAKIEGDIFLAGMLSMTHTDNTGFCNSSSILDQDGLQVISAIKYGLLLLKSRNVLPNITLGLVAINTCQNPDHTLDESREFLKVRFSAGEKLYVCPDGSNPKLRTIMDSFRNIFAVIGAANSDVSIMAANYLRLVEIPQISFFSTSPNLSNVKKFPVFFRTIPNDDYTLKSIVKILQAFRWSVVQIVMDDSEFSKNIVIRLEDLLALTNDVQSNGQTYPVCSMKEKVTIDPNDIGLAVRKIIKTREEVPEKYKAIVVMLIKQSIAQEFLQYVERNPNPQLSQILWIGTDSWIARNWPGITAKNPILQRVLGVIPSSIEVPGFWNFYTNQIPSQTDENPWLARKFELVCNCQYTSNTTFIHLQLIKIRADKKTTACETIEESCRTKVFADSTLMPYIHYVMDAVLAYGYAVQDQLPTSCISFHSENCYKQLWNALNLSNLKRTLSIISFKDSTNATFSFWSSKNNSERREGIPNYSIVEYDSDKAKWNIIGDAKIVENVNVTNDNNSNIDYSLRVRLLFSVILRFIHYEVEPCKDICKIGSARIAPLKKSGTLSSKLKDPDRCCSSCKVCSETAIVKRVNNDFEECQSCPTGEKRNPNNFTVCKKKEIVYMSYKSTSALVVVILDMLGLLISIAYAVIMITNWYTPIMRAFVRETSTILLIGTILSLIFSIVLLDKPNNINCVLRWMAPGFCSTVCYAAILTKTNRIARIFALKPSSRKNYNPKFISPLSQINIVLLIVGVELLVLIIIVTTQKPKVTNTPKTNEIMKDCTNMNTSNVTATFFLPILLLLITTVYAFRIRKTPDGYNETRNINFLNFANCVLFFSCLLLQQLLKNTQNEVLPLCLLLTLGAHGNLLALFSHKIYLLLCRPEKNTVQAVWTKTRTQSETTLGTSMQTTTQQSFSSDIKLESLRCRDCNSSISSNTLVIGKTSTNTSTNRLNSPTKVQFVLQNSSPNKNKLTEVYNKNYSEDDI